MFVRRTVRRVADRVFADADYVVELGSRVKVFEALWREQGSDLRFAVSEQVRRALWRVKVRHAGSYSGTASHTWTIFKKLLRSG